LHSATPNGINLDNSAYQIKLTDFDGVFWRGSAGITVNNLSMGRVHWKILASALADGRLGASVTFLGPFHDFGGLFFSNGDYLQIDQLDGQIGADAITPFSSAYGLYPVGTLRIKGMDVELQRRWLTRLKGELLWDGGPVQYRKLDARATYPLPPMNGHLSMVDSELKLDVLQTQGSLMVLEATLQSSGWGAVSIYKRFFDLAGKKWLATETADDVALMVEQKLW
jgi:hypothetical protein